MPDLPYSQCIERCPERPGNLGGDRDSSAGEPYDDGRDGGLRWERVSKPPARIDAISERESAHTRTR
jgi:hypothetical protein